MANTKYYGTGRRKSSVMFETLDEAIESNITDGFVYILNSPANTHRKYG